MTNDQPSVRGFAVSPTGCSPFCRGIGRPGHGGGFRSFRKRYANLEAQRGPAAARIL
jgi:hypothetical protein